MADTPTGWDRLEVSVLDALKYLREGQEKISAKFDNFISDNNKDARDLLLKMGRLEDRMALLEKNTEKMSNARTAIISSITGAIVSGILLVVLLKGLGLR